MRLDDPETRTRLVGSCLSNQLPYSLGRQNSGLFSRPRVPKRKKEKAPVSPSPAHRVHQLRPAACALRKTGETVRCGRGAKPANRLAEGGGDPYVEASEAGYQGPRAVHAIDSFDCTSEGAGTAKKLSQIRESNVRHMSSESRLLCKECYFSFALANIDDLAECRFQNSVHAGPSHWSRAKAMQRFRSLVTVLPSDPGAARRTSRYKQV